MAPQTRILMKLLFQRLPGICLLMGMAITIAVAQTDTVAHWAMDKAVGKLLVEQTVGSNYAQNGFRPSVDLVTGVRGKALRTDGYSTWLTGALSATPQIDSLTVSAWVALETYPVKTASIWASYDPSAQRGLALSIDPFGRIVVEVSVTNQLQTLVSERAIPHWQWQHIVASINTQQGRVSLFVNGGVWQQFSIPKGALTWATTAVNIGKSPATEKSGLFDLNVLNGLLDEIIILKRPLSATQVATTYAQQKPATTPDLHTPASRFVGDYQRPLYHPIPASNWANESHGFIYHKGVYHLFYQKNGNGPYFSNQNWGHLQSLDLVTWTEKPVALWPSPNSFDKVGIWSGHLVLNTAGQPSILYTGVDGVKAGIGLATSDDSLLVWQKSPADPVISGSPATFPNRDFRDPYLFQENGSWYMIVGSGLVSPEAGTVFLYKSTDLTNWTLKGPLFIGDPINDQSGTFWEMPVFWKFGNQYVLLVNKIPQSGTPARAFYWVGQFSNDVFKPNTLLPQYLEVNNILLSPSVNTDASGTVTAIGIIPDNLSPEIQYQKGYANLFSIPRTWSLSNGRLVQRPHPALEKLRGQENRFTTLTLTESGSNYLGALKGWQLELQATVQPGPDTQQFGFIVGKSANNAEYTKIYYDYTYKQLVVDRTHSSTATNVPRDIQPEFYNLAVNQDAEWRVFIDGSVVEVFLNGDAVVSTRIFPGSSSSNAVDVFVKGGNAILKSGQAWTMNGQQAPVVITAVESEPTTGLDIRHFPNPADDSIEFRLPDKGEGRLNIELLTIDGKPVGNTVVDIRESNGRYRWRLPAGLPAGLYVLRYLLNHQVIKTEKLTIAH